MSILLYQILGHWETKREKKEDKCPPICFCSDVSNFNPAYQVEY